ncbi:hypothetical protein AB0D14_02050 [Streptomyces sp. NPDC048484]|uniref:hypothetical protein n=1 Tax=Streptomyces sp. NPDC048484 TaxID=3155146 RepID=UPI00343D5421
MEIPSIETRYADHRFRSRLEARWAVFFDTLGIPWQYEPQGFELIPLPAGLLKKMKDEWLREPEEDDRGHLGNYLPDFYLPKQEAWFEVKGVTPKGREWERLCRFMLLTEQRVFIAAGSIPDTRTFEETGHPYDENNFDILTYGDHHYAWTRCRWCGFYDITFDARSARTRCGCHHKHYAEAPCCNGDKCYRGNEPEIIAAYAAARSARFEHGQSGA